MLFSNNVISAEKKSAFQVWLNQVKMEALAKGIKPNVVKKLLSNVSPNRRVIKRDRNQTEFKLTLSVYLNRVVTSQNVLIGKRKAVKHADLLQSVSKKFGVQPRFILAVWGIETRFGAVNANVPLISAVATLAYDARRSNFFRKQLFAVLEMVDKGYAGSENLFGSWAGAMGQPQFMPTSYLAYARDFDGDGRRDIWNNEADVFASIANYLASHGWDATQTWGRKVLVPGILWEKLGRPSRRVARGCRAKVSQRKLLSEWNKLGVKKIDGEKLPSRRIKASLVLPDGQKGADYYLVYKNYASIMSYNCAHLYAVTVGTLADQIGRQ
tara:strand:- start:1114 stop:2091 length:978 start_codon:yes stop_codon:yes gene_type:complete